MTDKAFLDTNILVYAYDKHSPEKQKEAQAILTDGIEHDDVVLSVQVLGEFFNVVTRHINNPMSVDEVRSIIAALSILPVQEIDLPMVKRAIDTHQTYRISYWDSLIIAAAERAGCKKIFSEDLNDDQTYRGILVHNPFSRR
jgi:predicted nucleic acid-binding protein